LMDEAATVTMEEDALNRIYAYWTALEYTGHCAMGKFKEERDPTNVLQACTGGPLNFLQELESRRRETHGLKFLVLIDQKVRRKIHELTSEDSDKFPNTSMALHHVLHHCQHIWSEARMECYNTRGGGQDKESGGGHKRRRDDSDSESSRGGGKRARARGKNRERQRDNKQKGKGNDAPIKPKKEQRGDEGRRGDRGQDRTSGRDGAKTPKGREPKTAGIVTNRVPEKEFKGIHDAKQSGKDLKKRCKFFNLSCGCSFGNECKKDHVCWQCGGDHKWVDKHFR
jgi:hypothetical protein